MYIRLVDDRVEITFSRPDSAELVACDVSRLLFLGISLFYTPIWSFLWSWHLLRIIPFHIYGNSWRLVPWGKEMTVDARKVALLKLTVGGGWSEAKISLWLVVWILSFLLEEKEQGSFSMSQGHCWEKASTKKFGRLRGLKGEPHWESFLIQLWKFDSSPK